MTIIIEGKHLEVGEECTDLRCSECGRRIEPDEITCANPFLCVICDIRVEAALNGLDYA